MLECLFAFINVVLLSYALLRSKFDFVYPPVLYFGTWSVSAVGYALMSSYWGATMHLNTFLFMSIGGFLFLVGCEFSALCAKPILFKTGLSRIKKARITRRDLVMLLAVDGALLLYVYMHQYALATSVNPSISKTEISKILEYARYAIVYGKKSNTRLYINVIRIIYVLALVLFYDYIRNRGKRTKWVAALELFHCGFLPAITILAAVRTYLLGIISGYIVIYFALVRRRRKYTSRQALRIMRKLVAVALLFIVVFGILNATLLSRTQKKGYMEILSYTMKYVSSSLAAFDYYVNHPEMIKKSYFGASTFQSVYVFLRAVNLTQKEIFQTFLPFTPTLRNGFSTNVYTLYFQYVYDFGVWGILVNFVNGLVYGWIFKTLSSRRRSSVRILSYAVMALPLTMSFFAEQLWTMINTHVVRLLLLWILLHFIDLDW